MNNNISVRDMQQAHDLYQIGKHLSAEEIDNVMKNKGHITSLKDLNFFGKIKRNFIEKRLRQNKLRKSDIRFLLRHVGGRATKGCLTPFVAYVANENLRDKFTRITLFEINKPQQTATIRLFKEGGKGENIFYKKAGTKYEPDDKKTTQFNNSEEEISKLHEGFVQQQKTFEEQQRAKALADAAAARMTLAKMQGSWEQQLINQQKIDETRADVRNQIINEQKIAATLQKDADNKYADLQREVIENQNDEILSKIERDSQELREKIREIREKNSTPFGSSNDVD